MIFDKLLRLSLAAMAPVIAASAQDVPRSPLGSLATIVDSMRVPLHTHKQVAGTPDYGWWAAGRDWKASFHDGFAFYPYRGPERELVRLQWRTESIEIGGAPLPLEVLGVETTDDRFTTRYADVHEVYEMRAGGVEQMFVIPRRPARTGGIVVTGRISGDLSTEHRQAAHQDLVFCADGEATVRYGRAFAFDAVGNRVGIETSYENGCVRLHVPSPFVEQAVFPLTIDPLVGSAVISANSTSSPIASSAIATSTVVNQMVVAYVRQFASNDTDGFAIVGQTDYTQTSFFWNDIAANYETPEVDIAYSEGARSYVIPFVREYATYSIAHIYHQQDNMLVLNSGTTRSLANATAGEFWSQPAVGGGYGTCENALTVWTREINGVRKARGAVLWMGNPGGLILFDLDLNPQGETMDPDVMPMTVDSRAWRVVWRAEVGSQNEIRSSMVDQTSSQTVSTGHDLTSSTVSAPQVAGAYDEQGNLRSVMVWERAGLFNKTARVFDFSANPVRTILSGSQFRLGDLVADSTTASNYLLSHSSVLGSGRQFSLSRLGGSGNDIDVEPVATAGAVGSVCMCHEPAGGTDFLVAYSSTSAGQPLLGARFSYPTNATSVAYAAGCSLAGLSAFHPFAGNFHFAVKVTNLAPGTPVVLAASSALGNVPLGVLGIPCPLSLSPAGLLTLAGISTNDTLSFPIPLPDDPVFLGDLYVQAVLPFSGEATVARRIQVR